MADETPVKLSPADLMQQVGSSGLLQYSGYVVEDKPPQGEIDWTRTYQTMRDNSPIIGALLQAFEALSRPVTWQLEPADDTPDAQAYADFVDGCLEDMDQTWEDTLSEIATMYPFGWALMEQIYKRRQGAAKDATGNPDPVHSSRYTDGKIGWGRWALRAQETRLRWEFDYNGNTLGMWQIAPPHYITTFLPMEKCLLFRTTTRKGNPEGRSLLRNAWRPWTYMEKIERLEGIGIERDLAGLPVYGIPASVMQLAASGASTAEAQAAMATITAAQKIVQNLRRDTQEGVVKPVAYDEHGHDLYPLTLLSTGGARQFDTDKIIQRYGHQIVMSVLADFIYVGHESVGSFALIREKTKVFTTALGGYLDMIAAVVNTYAIPRLIRYNGMDESLAPRLTRGDVGDISLTELGAYLTALGPKGANLIDPTDDALRQHVLDVANLPMTPLPADASQNVPDDTVTDEAATPEDESEEVPG